jgi:hypothetical protein
MRELIDRYHPALLWNDIDYPKSGHPLQIMAEYYNTVPDGVIDNRFGVKHSDFKSPEYQTMDKISETKWEECRGLGRSFGYNCAEGEAEMIAHLSVGGHREQERKPFARCRSGSRRHNSSSVADTSASAGRMA